MGSDVRHVRGEAQKELVKKFEVFSSNGRSRWQVWSDWITMSAIAVSNATDQSHFDEREKQYLSIAGKYTRPEMEAFTEMLALLVVALEDNPEQDFLGELYMCLGLGNDHAGQFFTPYHLCEFMSAVTTPAEEFQQKIGDRGWVAVCDPTCGAGALLVAFANECRKKGINYQTDADLEDAKPFIEEWQQVVQGRMTASEISFAKQSKEIRAQEFAELKENGNIIRTGANAGKLLVDELMHDLMEVEKRVG